MHSSFSSLSINSMKELCKTYGSSFVQSCLSHRQLLIGTLATGIIVAIFYKLIQKIATLEAKITSLTPSLKNVSTINGVQAIASTIMPETSKMATSSEQTDEKEALRQCLAQLGDLSRRITTFETTISSLITAASEFPSTERSGQVTTPQTDESDDEDETHHSLEDKINNLANFCEMLRGQMVDLEGKFNRIVPNLLPK